jgi:hypothetical protein
MQRSKIFSEISHLTQTVDELALLKEELGRLKSSLFLVGGGGFDEALTSRVRLETSFAIRSLAASSGLGNAELIDTLVREIDKVEVLELTLAFSPTRKFIDKLCVWVRGNIEDYLALKIICDPKIIGGTKVIWQGKYLDLSLRKRFEEKYSKL